MLLTCLNLQNKWECPVAIISAMGHFFIFVRGLTAISHVACCRLSRRMFRQYNEKHRFIVDLATQHQIDEANKVLNPSWNTHNTIGLWACPTIVLLSLSNGFYFHNLYLTIFNLASIITVIGFVKCGDGETPFQKFAKWIAS